MAREFARHGSRLVLCARDEQELDQARLDLETSGAKVMVVPCDVTNKQDVNAMIAFVNSHFGGVDVLVNNAARATQTSKASMNWNMRGSASATRCRC